MSNDNSKQYNKQDSKQARINAFHLLDDTDIKLQELESVVRVAAMGLTKISDGRTMEDVLMHVANDLQSIRAQLDEATSAAMTAIRTAAA